ncbi:hypothetical protein [Nostoc sp. CHAB 5715]|nr:hypothetical protein [Nostoc sp. CHAB 5715]MCC5624309.1 hypothetical protein [Nostoc sp. CHAB 5715]
MAMPAAGIANAFVISANSFVIFAMPAAGYANAFVILANSFVISACPYL